MNKRNEAIDVAKGIGIILVVLGHVIPRGFLWNLIYSVHMPLFILCSGLFHDNKKSAKHILKIGMSYCLFGIFAIAIWGITVEKENAYYFKQSIFNMLMGGTAPRFGIYPVEAIWFLPCLICIIAIFSIIVLVKENGIRIIIIAICAALGLTLSRYREGVNMWYNIDIALVLLPFYALGYSSKNMICSDEPNVTYFKSLYGKKRPLILAAICIAYVIICEINGHVNIYKGIFGRTYALLFLSSYIGIIIILDFAKVIVRINRYIKKICTACGSNSLIIMGTHQLVINLARTKCKNLSGYVPVLFLAGIAVPAAVGMLITITKGKAKCFKSLIFKSLT